jgi:glycine/D-amino acid oxidase-like deaminating enzyme
VVRLDPAPAVRLADGTIHGYDAVVVAAGPWTPALLAASDLPAGGLRTKQIQYTFFAGGLPGLGAFVDDLTGLYGRPAGDGEFLLGLPCDRWDVDPAAVAPDTELVERVTERARHLLGTGRPHRTRASSDCYHDQPGLELRPTRGAVFTFTGGSGGAAKSVLADSRRAAAALLGQVLESNVTFMR